MGLFGITKKKKDEPLSRLSEKEIQLRLYGNYSANDVSAPQPISKSSEKSVTVSKRPPIETIGPSSGDLFQPGRPAAEPVESHSSHSSLNPAPSLSPEKKEEVKSFRVSSDVRSHSEVKRAPVPKPASSRFSAVKPPKPRFDWQKKAGEVLQKAGMVARSLVFNFFVIVLKGIRAVATTVYQRRQSFRRLLYWAAAVGAIFAIFSSVHYLNVKREQAMRSANPTVIDKSPVKATAPKPKSESPLSAVAVEAVPPAAKADQEVTETPAASEATAASPATGAFVIQVVTYYNETDASKMASELTSAGWPAFVKKIPTANGRTFFQVYIGRFASYADAQKKLSDFRNQELAASFKDAFIRKLKD